MAPVGLRGMKGSSLLTFGGKRRKAEVSTPLLISSGASFERPEVLRSERKRRASIFRFRSAHRGKSFGIAADAARTNVLPGVAIFTKHRRLHILSTIHITR